MLGVLSCGKGAVAGDHHEQIIRAAFPPCIHPRVQGQGGLGRKAGSLASLARYLVDANH